MNLSAIANALCCDNLIRVAINEAIGNDAWIIGDIASRMCRVKKEGQESEIYTLDGNPILEIWPPTMETVQEGNSMKLVASRKYRTFKSRHPPK